MERWGVEKFCVVRSEGQKGSTWETGVIKTGVTNHLPSLEYSILLSWKKGMVGSRKSKEGVKS